MKKLFMIILIMNFSVLIAAECQCSSIQEIIDSSTDGSDTMQQNKPGFGDKEDNFFAIQVSTYSDEAEANEQIINLQKKDLDPYIFQSLNSKGDHVYSVRIGKYDSYDTAAEAMTELKNKIQLPMIITFFNSLQPAATVLAKRAEPVQSFPDTESKESEISLPDNDTVYSINDPSLKALLVKISDMESQIKKLQDEADIRNQLQVTEEEAKGEEEDILEAAGREYVLTKEGTIKLSYGLGYSYSAYDAIREGTTVEDVADHTISNRLNFTYGLKDNLTVGAGIPFVYKYHKVGTIQSLDASDLGDLGISWQFQPVKSGSDKPSIIINGNFEVPVGRNPYEIQPGKELSTSSGIYSAGIGLSLSQVSDPVIVFSSFSISYPFATQSINQKRAEGTLDEVQPGMGIGVGAGLGYALSYKLNINASFSYTYSFETTYKYKDAPDATSGTGTSASFSMGIGYKLSRNQNLNFSIGVPITSSRSFSVSLSTPIDFAL